MIRTLALKTMSVMDLVVAQVLTSNVLKAPILACLSLASMEPVCLLSSIIPAMMEMLALPMIAASMEYARESPLSVEVTTTSVPLKAVCLEPVSLCPTLTSVTTEMNALWEIDALEESVLDSQLSVEVMILALKTLVFLELVSSSTLPPILAQMEMLALSMIVVKKEHAEETLSSAMTLSTAPTMCVWMECANTNPTICLVMIMILALKPVDVTWVLVWEVSRSTADLRTTLKSLLRRIGAALHSSVTLCTVNAAFSTPKILAMMEMLAPLRTSV